MRIMRFLMIGAVGLLLGGCSKDESSATSEVKPREAPTMTPSPSAVTPPPLDGADSGESMTALPKGHPPINSRSTLPADHTGGPAHEPEMALQLQMPPEFKTLQPKPSPMQPLRTYSVPRVEGDSEDAYVSISALGMKVPFQQNLDRWCHQFDLPEGKTCETGVKQQKLDGAAIPTTIVEVAGTYKGSPMMGPWPGAMPNFEMIVAEIDNPGKPYYVKLLGPQKTVEHWKAKLTDAIKAAR